jgi:hypothetical protein
LSSHLSSTQRLPLRMGTLQSGRLRSKRVASPSSKAVCTRCGPWTKSQCTDGKLTGHAPAAIRVQIPERRPTVNDLLQHPLLVAHSSGFAAAVGLVNASKAFSAHLRMNSRQRD